MKKKMIRRVNFIILAGILMFAVSIAFVSLCTLVSVGIYE